MRPSQLLLLPPLVSGLLLCLSALGQAPGVTPTSAPKARASKVPAGVVAHDWKAEGKQGMVVAGGTEAVDAGLVILQAGGNAFDAAAAVLLAQTVTDAHNFAFGSEVAILTYDAERKVVESISGQGPAPRLATREYFEKKGGIPAGGIESAAVPGAVDAILLMLERRGTMSLEQVATPTLTILDRGEQAWHEDLAKTIRGMVKAEKGQKDRAVGLRAASDFFYRGPVARGIDAWSREKGGLIRFSDMATYAAQYEPVEMVKYRGYDVYKCGAWTQGPMLLQTLGMLEGFELKGVARNELRPIHVAVEAMKLGFADRDWYLGDPAFVAVPLKEMLVRVYLDARRGLIDVDRASKELRPGDPRGGKALLDNARLPAGKASSSNDTTTCIVADRFGNVVAATPSGWSGVLAGGTGVWLGSRLQSFNVWEGHPNCIEPGKRPRVTLTPTLVLDDKDRPVMAVSVAGGDAQDQVTLQVLMNMIDFGMAPAEAVTGARFMTNHLVGSFGQKPAELGSLVVNPEIGEKVIEALKQRGHAVTVQEKYIWEPTALRIDREMEVMRGAGDPRAGRHAGGY